MTKRKYTEDDFQIFKTVCLMHVMGSHEHSLEKDFVDYLLKDQYLMMYIDLIAVTRILGERLMNTESEDSTLLLGRLEQYLIKLLSLTEDILALKACLFLELPKYDITGDTWELSTYDSNGLGWQVWNKVSFRGTAAAGSVHPVNNDKIVGTYRVQVDFVSFNWSWTTGSGATETQSYTGKITEKNYMSGSFEMSTSEGYSEKGTWYTNRNTN